jgi:hypothetical protein
VRIWSVRCVGGIWTDGDLAWDCVEKWRLDDTREHCCMALAKLYFAWLDIAAGLLNVTLHMIVKTTFDILICA